MCRASLVSTSMYPSWYCSQHVRSGGKSQAVHGLAMLQQVSHMHVQMCAPHQQQALQQDSHMHVGMLTLPKQQALLLHKCLLVQVQLGVSASHKPMTETESSPCACCCDSFQSKF